MTSLHWVVFAALLACAVAGFEKALFYNCEEVPADACTVNEVRIDPCKKNKKCIFPKGSNASISFDFVPNFATSKLQTGLFSGGVEFDQMHGKDACTLTACPTEAGKAQTLDYTLYIGKMLPQGTHTFKWKLWNPDNEAQMCCFRTTVQLRKK